MATAPSNTLGSAGSPSSAGLSGNFGTGNISTGSGYTGVDHSFGSSATSSSSPLTSQTGSSSLGGSSLSSNSLSGSSLGSSSLGQSSTTGSSGTIDIGGAQTSGHGMSTPGGVVKVRWSPTSQISSLTSILGRTWCRKPRHCNWRYRIERSFGCLRSCRWQSWTPRQQCSRDRQSTGSRQCCRSSSRCSFKCCWYCWTKSQPA